MIISKTPFRISFFGGGTDIESFYRDYGGEVLGSTINKFCYITLREQLYLDEYSFRLAYSKIERRKNYKEIRHPLLREILRYYKLKILKFTLIQTFLLIAD